jgi:hypothetical protein
LIIHLFLTLRLAFIVSDPQGVATPGFSKFDIMPYRIYFLAFGPSTLRYFTLPC